MKAAFFVRNVDPEGDGYGVVAHGAKAVYRLSEPLETEPGTACDYVFVSTATVLGQPETYAFPCDELGIVLSWTELPCSMKGRWSHADVLREAGYELAVSDG